MFWFQMHYTVPTISSLWITIIAISIPIFVACSPRNMARIIIYLADIYFTLSSPEILRLARGFSTMTHLIYDSKLVFSDPMLEY